MQQWRDLGWKLDVPWDEVSPGVEKSQRCTTEDAPGVL